MREILFRAKAINIDPNREYRTNYKNGDWVYGLIERIYDERFPNLPSTMINQYGVSDIDVDYKTISAYTGLTDKNGKKIFDGDICNYGDYVGVIGFDEDDCKFILTYDETDITDFSCIWGKELEVIGNIFEKKRNYWRKVNEKLYRRKSNY